MIDALYIAQVDNTPEVVIEHKTTAETHSFNGMFDYTEAFGLIRTAYIHTAQKVDTEPKTTKSSTAVGGAFGLDTGSLYDFKFHIAAYLSKIVPALSPSTADTHEDFVDFNGDSFIYLAEASIDYNSEDFQVKVGRIRIDTPYADSDDIRLAPNTFEGASANINYSSKLTTQILYLNKWAGYDSQDGDANLSQNKFKNLISDAKFGMVSASLSYEYAQDSQMSYWCNYIDGMALINYVEIAGTYYINSDDIHLDYGFQVSNINEIDNSNVDGNVLGTMLIANYKGLLFGGAYNIAYSPKDNSITDGFGGGPYYTSLDEATLGAMSENGLGSDTATNDVEAFRIGAGYEFENLGINGLVLELIYGKFYNSKRTIQEKNILLTYEMSDRWYAEATYAHYDSSSDKTTFDRALFRIDYNF